LAYYAIKAAEIASERFTYLFLSQTPSIHSMKNWIDINIPKILTYPLIGQLVNSFTEKKLAKAWYRTALPKDTDKTEYQRKALNSLQNGGCYELAKKQMKLGGPMVSFTAKGGLDKGISFLNNLKMISFTSNLGDTRSIATHPASTTHSKLSAEEKKAVGIEDGLIRVSVGLEHISDIIGDIEQALK